LHQNKDGDCGAGLLRMGMRPRGGLAQRIVGSHSSAGLHFIDQLSRFSCLSFIFLSTIHLKYVKFRQP
jgi:hypothetical protein